MEPLNRSPFLNVTWSANSDELLSAKNKGSTTPRLCKGPLLDSVAVAHGMASARSRGQECTIVHGSQRQPAFKQNERNISS